MTCDRCRAVIDRQAEALVARLISLHPSETVLLWMPRGATR